MVSSPRIIQYELLIIEYAIDLLQAFAKKNLFNRSTLEDDIKRYQMSKDYKMKFVLNYNIQRKLIL